MAVILASTKEMTREEWLSLRKRGIGGSDAAAIAGFSPYRSAYAVFLEKTGQLADDEPGEAAYWGSTLEDVVAAEFAKRTGFKTTRKNAILQHPTHTFMLANLDRYVMAPDRGRGVLEVKTASEYKRGDWDGDKVPDAYMIQMQHYLAVTGLQFGYFAVLIGGNKFRHTLVSRDDRLIEALIQLEADFWRRVEENNPPAPDGLEATGDLLNALYPESKPLSEMDLPPHAMDLLVQYDAAKADEEAAKLRKEEAANRIKALMGEYEIGWCGDRKVVWKTITSERLDSKAFKAAHPEIAAKFLKPSTYRRFEVK